MELVCEGSEGGCVWSWCVMEVRVVVCGGRIGLCVLNIFRTVCFV